MYQSDTDIPVVSLMYVSNQSDKSHPPQDSLLYLEARSRDQTAQSTLRHTAFTQTTNATRGNRHCKEMNVCLLGLGVSHKRGVIGGSNNVMHPCNACRN